MAQALYTDDDPHLTQGLFRGIITVLGDIHVDMLPPRREVQVLAEDAPIPGSLTYYSRASLKQLKRVPKVTLQLAEQLYQRTTSQLTTVILSSSRWSMFGIPAAAAGRASEAWVSGQDAVQRALQILQQPPKQLYLLKSSSRAAAAGGNSVDLGIQQAQALPGHADKQAQQPAQLPQQQSQLLQPIQPQQQNPELLHAGSLQQQPQEQQHPPAQVSSWPPSAQQQLPCTMPSLHNGLQPATVPPAVQPVMHNQTAYATAPCAYQPWMHTGMPMDQHHPAYPAWPSYPYPYYGYSPVPAGPWGWPPMPPSWGLQGPVGGAAGPWGNPPAAEAPHWLQPLTTAAALQQLLLPRLLCLATMMLHGCSKSR